MHLELDHVVEHRGHHHGVGLTPPDELHSGKPGIPGLEGVDAPFGVAEVNLLAVAVAGKRTDLGGAFVVRHQDGRRVAQGFEVPGIGADQFRRHHTIELTGPGHLAVEAHWTGALPAQLTDRLD